MIKKLKIFAIAMLVTGATVSTTRATDYNTNLIQPITVTLTAYTEKATNTSGSGTTTVTVNSGSYKTKDLIHDVAAALGTSVPAGFSVTSKTEIGILTTNNLGAIVGTTNVVTNINVTTSALVPISTNTVILEGITSNLNSGTVTFTTNTNNVTIGNAAGDYYVTLVGTNSTNDVLVTSLGINGPVTTTNSATNLTLYANQTLAISNGVAVPTETNETTTVVLGNGTLSTSTPFASETASIVVISNLTTVLNAAIATNSLSVSTNASGVITVTLGTISTNEYTNTATVTNAVYIVTATDTNVVVSTNGTAPALGATNTLATTLTSTISISTNFVTNFPAGQTNVITGTTAAIVTSATEYTTVSMQVTNTNNVYGTNETSGLFLITSTNYASVPTNIVNFVKLSGTNNVESETTKDSTNTAQVAYEIKSFNLYTNTSNPISVTLQGFVKKTLDNDKEDKTVVPVYTEAWTANGTSSGTNGVEVILNGSISIGSPSAQKIPIP